jgi:hypothetical protein
MKGTSQKLILLHPDPDRKRKTGPTPSSNTYPPLGIVPDQGSEEDLSEEEEGELDPKQSTKKTQRGEGNQQRNAEKQKPTKTSCRGDNQLWTG